MENLKNTESKNGLVKYFWQVTYAHTISYFVAGLIAVTFFDYKGLWATEVIEVFYRDINSPVIALGGGLLQIPRGIIVALVLLPLRKVFFEEKFGLLKLALIIFGFSVVSTFSAAVTSYEGLIYLSAPFIFHLRGIPEALIWLSLFIGILFIATKYSHKKIITVLSIIIMILISLMSIMGYLSLSGIITV